MSGFMSSSTALMICKTDSAASLGLDALRQHAFTPEIDADGRRFGWVGLGDPLDTDGFELASVDARFMGFSFRLDTRKASGAVIRLHLAEAVREEIASGKKVGGKRKKELKEAITAKLTAKAEFVPSIIDCVWDAEKGRLLVASASAKAVQPVLDLFKTSFGIDAAPITPAGDMPKLFSAILRGEGYPCLGYTLHAMGSASLAAPEQAEEKAVVAVQNSLNAVAQALEEGMAIQKLHLVATSDADPDRQLEFTLDAGLAISGLKLPKAEKGAEEDAAFLVNADICSRVADMVEALASA
ncbi:recombination-associated protein RdgC [Desulfovibrio sp. SGI.169]|uniref:recombination-associated protein RdgC n=1 Tax=Desulfovibrio sp. SGI.169 TaxID=3420561 RepID=UPI003D04FC6E